MKKVIDILLPIAIACTAIYLWLAHTVIMSTCLAVVLLIMFWPSIIDTIQNIKNPMNNLFNNQEIESYEIRFKDIDPDTGNISQDHLVVVVEGLDEVEHMLKTLAKEYMDTEHDPNRVFYFKPYVR